jgi:hypothetical protein
MLLGGGKNIGAKPQQQDYQEPSGGGFDDDIPFAPPPAFP